MNTTTMPDLQATHNGRCTSCAEPVSNEVARATVPPDQPRDDAGGGEAREMLPPQRDPRFRLILYLQLAFDRGGLPALLAHMRRDAEDHARTHRSIRRHAISFNRRDQEVAWGLTSGRCFYCGMQLLGPNVCAEGYTHEGYGLPDWGAAWIEVDHYVPRKLGGSSRRENLRPACRWCNQVKRGHSIATFRKMFAREHGSPFFYGEIAS